MTIDLITKKLLPLIKKSFLQKIAVLLYPTNSIFDLVPIFDLSIKPERNGVNLFSNLLLCAPKLNEVQATGLLNINAMDLRFIDTAYGAWKLRILRQTATLLPINCIMGIFKMFNFSISKFWKILQDERSDIDHSRDTAASSAGESDQPEVCDADWHASAGFILEDIAMVSKANAVSAPLIQTKPHNVDETAAEAVKLASVYQSPRTAFDPGSFAAGRSMFHVKPMPQRRHVARGLWISPNLQDDI